MSYPTVPAYIQRVKGWDPKHREHPVIDWMFDYEEGFDRGDMIKGPHAPWHSDDFTFNRSGTVFPPGEASWKALCDMYAPFVGHYHEPFFYIIWQTETGYELFGSATLYAKLPVPGESTKTDGEGRKWDIGAPGAFHFEYVKDPTGPKGMKLKGQKLYADGMLMVSEMVKRGMVTPEQVMAQAP